MASTDNWAAFCRRVLAMERGPDWAGAGEAAITPEHCWAALCFVAQCRSFRPRLPLPQSAAAHQGWIALTWWKGEQCLAVGPDARAGMAATLWYADDPTHPESPYHHHPVGWYEALDRVLGWVDDPPEPPPPARAPGAPMP